MLTVTLSAPAQSVMDVLTGEGLGNIDLDAVAVLAVPLWELPADHRSTVAALCEHPDNSSLVPRATGPGSRAPTQPENFLTGIFRPYPRSNTAGWLLSHRRSR